jgi:hypothetical protein
VDRSPEHREKDIALSWLLQQMAITGKFLTTLRQERH